jgi:hypothetical protein
MTDEKPKQMEPPLLLGMSFGEALKRFAHTKPEEVEPLAGRKKKRSKLKMVPPRIETMKPRVATFQPAEGKPG